MLKRLIGACAMLLIATTAAAENPRVMLQTSHGDMLVELYADKAPISVENFLRYADNGVLNTRYTLAMARTQVVDSATSQFFINLGNNEFLNHGGRDFGYAVFAEVVDGQHVVETIAKVPTGNQGMHQNVPNSPVTIISAKRVEATEE